MCLSCHRAHGSPYADILRWNYDEMRTGSYTTTDSGCFTCHTGKNAD
ncbi:MAG: cytochrome c3 family protein [Thermodesulfovibrionales bacterium]